MKRTAPKYGLRVVGSRYPWKRAGAFRARRLPGRKVYKLVPTTGRIYTRGSAAFREGNRSVMNAVRNLKRAGHKVLKWRRKFGY